MLHRTLALGILVTVVGSAQVPVVVELFTSEGCSSCPPAEEMLTRLDSSSGSSDSGRAGRAGRGGKQFAPITTAGGNLPGRGLAGVTIIALGEHVDYWDQLGWKDRFSSPLFSARQQDYGIALRQSTVYTPQAIINGHYQVTGSDERALTDAIRSATTEPRASVGISLSSPQVVSFRISKLPQGSHESDILLAVTEGNIRTSVTAGENKGVTLRDVAVVRSITSLGKLDPRYPGEYSAEAVLNLRPEWVRQNVKLVLLVQDRTNRRILGAGFVKLPN